MNDPWIPLLMSFGGDAVAISLVVAATVLGFRTHVGSYLQKKGDNLATKEDIQEIKRPDPRMSPTLHIVVLATTAILTFTKVDAFAQSPDAAFQLLPLDQQAWVSRSCPRSLGPSLWSSCVNREVRALRAGLPDLTRLSDSDRDWVQRSCPQSLGPSLVSSCLSRESNALRAGLPKIELLSSENRAWIQQSCPRSLGPSLYKACTEREARALISGANPARSQPDELRAREAPLATPQVRSGRPAGVYPIETSHNDELFIINGEKFEAKTYCFNMREDDEVLFLDGSPSGVCLSATLLNLRTREKCEVWCE